MIGTSKNSRFLGNMIFTKEEALFLSKIRIIKKNLVHVHGFPSSLANIELLGKPEYFGQYGKIQKTLLTQKTNPETNKKSFSAYITYSNEKEAAFAILSVDSLLVEGKIIRAFFGTTKYCNFFLNNTRCPNLEKCMFLHQLIKEKDIIIDSNTVFSYNEHLDLAKKIIKFSNPETKYLVQSMPKMKKTIFPNIDFIFLNEKEKENYFHSSQISYIKGNNNYNENNLNLSFNNNLNLRRNKLSQNLINNIVNYNKDQNGYLIKNNSIGHLSFNSENNKDISNLLNTPKFEEKSNKSINPNDPFFLHNLFHNSIKHILYVKPFFIKLENNIPLKEMEFDYLKKDLNKNGNNIYALLDGCLDCVK